MKSNLYYKTHTKSDDLKPLKNTYHFWQTTQFPETPSETAPHQNTQKYNVQGRKK